MCFTGVGRGAPGGRGAARDRLLHRLSDCAAARAQGPLPPQIAPPPPPRGGASQAGGVRRRCLLGGNVGGGSGGRDGGAPPARGVTPVLHMCHTCVTPVTGRTEGSLIQVLHMCHTVCADFGHHAHLVPQKGFPPRRLDYPKHKVTGMTRYNRLVVLSIHECHTCNWTHRGLLPDA
eukprot:9372361-Pyramimonas_sp.AAC.1